MNANGAGTGKGYGYVQATPALAREIEALCDNSKRNRKYMTHYKEFCKTRPSRVVWDFMCDQNMSRVGRSCWTVMELTIALNQSPSSILAELRHLEEYGLAVRTDRKGGWKLVE